MIRLLFKFEVPTSTSFQEKCHRFWKGLFGILWGSGNYIYNCLDIKELQVTARVWFRIDMRFRTWLPKVYEILDLDEPGTSARTRWCKRAGLSGDTWGPDSLP